MTLPSRISLLLAGAAAVCATAAPALAGTTPGGQKFDPKTDRETHLLSTALDGGFPNGPSRNAAFSQDRQLATRAAFESDATDIVPNDTNGFTDVFVVTRAQPYDLDGPPWRPGSTALVSTGLGGAPANGPSYKPDLSGDQLHPGRCVAFVSAASNLVPGDTNGKPDAFVRNLSTGRTVRVSVGTRGVQSNGTTYDVKIDGACDRVAFTSDATNLALTRAKRGKRGRALRPLVTSAPPAGTKQVYVRVLGGQQDDRGYTGVTFLASARKHRAGNGSSYDVAFGKLGKSCPQHCGTTSGDEIAYTSEATNLSGADHNGQPDVYRTEFTVPSFRSKNRGKPHYLSVGTVLVSRGGGGAGNGASTHAAINDAGDWVAFETTASNILSGDYNGVSDVVDANLVNGRVRKALWVSKSAAVGQPGNGASHDPVITRPGSPVFFESEATNLQPNDPGTTGGLHDENGVQDVFFWNFVSGNDSLQSRDSNNSIVDLPSTWDAVLPDFPAAPFENPAASYYGNYLAFETSNPLVDLQVASRLFPGLDANPRRVSEMALGDPALHQVYLRYIGPR